MLALCHHQARRPNSGVLHSRTHLPGMLSAHHYVPVKWLLYFLSPPAILYRNIPAHDDSIRELPT